MLDAFLTSLKASIKTLLLIGGMATVGAGLLTIVIGMNTPWAPWERQSNTVFPPVLFTLASFVATVAFCASTVMYHTLLQLVTDKPDQWWRISGVVFLVAYGTFSFVSQPTEAAIMLNILHLIVALPSLILLPRVCATG